MKSIFLAAVLVAAWPLAGFAQTDTTDQPQADSEFAGDYKVADQFQAALKADDRKAMAALIAYPLSREAPLTPITKAEDFVAHWDEFFDAATTKELLDGKAEQYGWRGIALDNGRVWFGQGHVVSIFTETAAGKQALANAKLAESKTLYPSVRGYTKVAFVCSTSTLNVRTQYHGKDLRYFAWKQKAAYSTKPDIELHGGTYDPQGTGGNFILSFKNRGFSYVWEVGHNLCGEDCNDYLEVMKGKKMVSRQVCTEAKD